jgi:regulator of sigma E protease
MLLENIFAVLLVLGTLVIVHEFGHYAAAKLFGVRVEVFSVGFGKRLFGFRKGDTDYRVSLLPLGGYVKMSGENPMEASTGDPAEFMSHPRWQRFIIALAGPAMNIILAILLLTGVYMLHYARYYFLEQPVVVGRVLEGSAAEKAGIKAGDHITQIDGVTNPVWEQAMIRELMAGGQPLEITVQRGEQTLPITVRPDAVGKDKRGVAGWEPPFLVNVTPDTPAERAGIKSGDQIAAFNGKPMGHSLTNEEPTAELLALLQENKDKPVQLTIRRDNKQLTVTLTPALVDIKGQKLYRLGVAPMARVAKLTLPEAFRASVEKNKEFATLIIVMVKKLVQQKVSFKQISGPVGIGQAAGDALREEGWMPLVGLTALISINLGIFNLFPIPILDGGMILLLMIEGLMRRDIKREIKERVYQAAFVFLVIFAVVVIYNDLSKLPGLGRFLP